MMVSPPSSGDEKEPSPDVQISSLDLDISLVDDVVIRKLLGVKDVCSSEESSSTEDLGAPKDHHDMLAEGEPTRTEETLSSSSAEHSSNANPEARLEMSADTAPASAEGQSVENGEPGAGELDVEQDDYKTVAQACTEWLNTVTMGTYDAPRRTAELYAPDGVLWGTEVHTPDDPLWGLVTEEIRDTPERIYAYYDFFARLPNLRLVEYIPAPVRVHGDFGAQSSTHKFAWQGLDGSTIEVRGRSSFTFRRDHPGMSNPWSIVEHCCFSMPTAATELKDVTLADGSMKTAPSSSVSTSGTDDTSDDCAASGLESSSSCRCPEEGPAADEQKLCSKMSRATSFQIQDRRLAEELAARQQHIAELQHRAETAESLAAERAALLDMERAARAKHFLALQKRKYVDTSPPSELDLEAAAVAAELAKQAAEHKIAEAARQKNAAEIYI